MDSGEDRGFVESPALGHSEQAGRFDTPTLLRAWDSLRVQNLNLKELAKK